MHGHIMTVLAWLKGYRKGNPKVNMTDNEVIMYSNKNRRFTNEVSKLFNKEQYIISNQ
jgi:hypothetical protein